MLHQKLNYIHNNPVKYGYVDDPAHWRYSKSARGEKCTTLILCSGEKTNYSKTSVVVTEIERVPDAISRAAVAWIIEPGAAS